jgi:hypothetical protein
MVNKKRIGKIVTLRTLDGVAGHMAYAKAPQRPTLTSRDAGIRDGVLTGHNS